MAFAASQTMQVLAPGTAGMMPHATQGPGLFAGGAFDDDDDDDDLLAAIRQVEDKVKADRENERIMKENAAQLDLELMLVDVDAT